MSGIGPDRFIPVNEDHVGHAARCELVPTGRDTWTWIIRAVSSADFEEFFSMFNAADSNKIVRFTSIQIFKALDVAPSLNTFDKIYLCRTGAVGIGTAWSIGLPGPDTPYGTVSKSDHRNPDFPYAIPEGITGFLYPTVSPTQWLSVKWIGGVPSDKSPKDVEMLPKIRFGQQFMLDEGEGILVTTTNNWDGKIAAQVAFTIETKLKRRGQ